MLFARERGCELFRRKPLALSEGHLLTLPGSLRGNRRIVFARHRYKSGLLRKGLVVEKNGGFARPNFVQCLENANRARSSLAYWF